ncbi:hypothetical protein J6590_001865 [Homalodisca vitripennis]|nr:hypothetical protein J6590_001865 [Homalodisca vitripennis]
MYALSELITSPPESVSSTPAAAGHLEDDRCLQRSKQAVFFSNCHLRCTPGGPPPTGVGDEEDLTAEGKTAFSLFNGTCHESILLDRIFPLARSRQCRRALNRKLVQTWRGCLKCACQLGVIYTNQRERSVRAERAALSTQPRSSQQGVFVPMTLYCE